MYCLGIFFLFQIFSIHGWLNLQTLHPWIQKTNDTQQRRQAKVSVVTNAKKQSWNINISQIHLDFFSPPMYLGHICFGLQTDIWKHQFSNHFSFRPLKLWLWITDVFWEIRFWEQKHWEQKHCFEGGEGREENSVVLVVFNKLRNC